MAAHAGLAGADARVVTADLRRLARGEPGGSEAVKWVGACGERARGLDAMLLVRIARMNAINVTRQVPQKHDPTAFPRVKTFARLQLTDEELEKWL